MPGNADHLKDNSIFSERTNLDWALKYVKAGWPVVPLWWIGRDGKCACGKSGCAAGKHPVTTLARHGWKDASRDEESVRRWWGQYPAANIGGVVGPESGVCVLDYDPRNDKDGAALAVFTEFCSAGDVAETLMSATGGGGWHRFYVFDSRFEIKGFLGDGFDAKKNGYVVLPPSTHVSGRGYEWTRVFDQALITDVPEPLLVGRGALAEKEKTFSDSGGVKVRENMQKLIDHDPRKFALLRKNGIGELQGPHPAHGSTGGGNFCVNQEKGIWHCFRHDCGGSAIHLAAVMSGIIECGEELRGEKFVQALGLAREAYGMDSDIAAGDGRFSWNWPDRTQKGRASKTLRNCCWILENNHDFERLFQRNLFSEKIELRRHPVWDIYKSSSLPVEMQDNDYDEFRVYLSRIGLEVSDRDLRAAIVAESRKIEYNPVLNYLKMQVWDGKGRLDTWLTDYAGAPDNMYVRMVGKILLVAACARIDKPGCKYDHMVVLEGPQDAGKSMLTEIMGGEWHAIVSLVGTDKDSVQNMMGKWWLECAEMVCYGHKEIESLKAFITTRVDRLRLPYGRNSFDCPRRSIFVGTFNPGPQGWLKDQTGHRRFFPVSVGRVDLDGLQDARDQLYAEAWVEYKKGFPLYIKDDNVLDMARREQESRAMVDEWDEAIEEWVNKQIIRPVRVSEILSEALGIPKKDHGMNRNAFRVSSILKKMGYDNMNGVPSRYFGKLARWWWPKGWVDGKGIPTHKDGAFDTGNNWEE